MVLPAGGVAKATLIMSHRTSSDWLNAAGATAKIRDRTTIIPENSLALTRKPDTPLRAKLLRRLCVLIGFAFLTATTIAQIGREVAIPLHLQDGQEFQTGINGLIAYGEKLFKAEWTAQEGAGRPLTKGTGLALSDSNSPLVFPRNFNRISGPDTNSWLVHHDAGGRACSCRRSSRLTPVIFEPVAI